MKLTDLLDEIDRLELEIYPGPWVANDLGIGYEITTQQQMPINSGIKDTFPRSDAEFIALARTVLPAMSKALRAVMEIHKPLNVGGIDGDHIICEVCVTINGYGGWDQRDHPCETYQAITDVLGDDDAA